MTYVRKESGGPVYREVFKPVPKADPGRVFYTITVQDVGKGSINTEAGPIYLAGVMGVVQKIDVGKQIYRVPVQGSGDQWIWQAENDRQMRERLEP